MRSQAERLFEIDELRLIRDKIKQGSKEWWEVTVQIIVIASDMPTTAISRSEYSDKQKAAAMDARAWLDGKMDKGPSVWTAMRMKK